MGQREDVTASLLASHGVDAVARRKVADQVSQVVVVAAGDVGVATAKANGLIGDGKMCEARTQVQASLRQAATAASAVVLASDLRAPAETRAEFIRRLADTTRAKIDLFMPESERPQAVRDLEAGLAQAEHEDNREMHVPPDRQGWRARLANVERLLAGYVTAVEMGDTDAEMGYPDSRVVDALAEVRSLLGGE